MKQNFEDALEIATHCAAIRRIIKRHAEDYPSIGEESEPLLQALELTAVKIMGIECRVERPGLPAEVTRIGHAASPTAEVT